MFDIMRNMKIVAPYLPPILIGALLIVVGSVVSEYYGLAYSYTYFDKGLHIAGGVLAAWISYRFLQKELSNMSAVKFLVVLVALVLLIGVFWEFAEYISSMNKETTPLLYRYFRGGGIGDTLADLVADMTGAIIFALIVYKDRSARKPLLTAQATIN